MEGSQTNNIQTYNIHRKESTVSTAFQTRLLRDTLDVEAHLSMIVAIFGWGPKSGSFFSQLIEKMALIRISCAV